MHGQAYSSGGFEVGRLYLVSHVVLILIWHGLSQAGWQGLQCTICPRKPVPSTAACTG